MSVLQAIILGAVQGLTEFLPVSSSGHLVLVPAWLGWEEHGIAFDVLLHAGTLLAVFAYFRADVARMLRSLVVRDPSLDADRRTAWLIIVGTVPTVLIALAFNDLFESLFLNPGAVGAFLCVTSASLIAAELLSHPGRRTERALTPGLAVLIGIAQGAAVAPGISRAGATIAAGLGAGLDREHAARFSFLLSMPVVLAATIKTLLDALTGTAALPGVAPSVVGFVTAAFTGYLAIAGLLAYLRRRSLYVFAAYTAVLGIAVLTWQFVL